MLTRSGVAHSTRLDGDLHFGYISEFNHKSQYFNTLKVCKQRNIDYHVVYNDAEAAMTRTGITLFKDTRISDVSVLSFDIEATGLNHDKDAKVLLISNTFKNARGDITRKLFSVDKYATDTEMIAAWCYWVREVDPAVMVGHNIFGYDLPYLNFRSGNGLKLGRLNNYTEFESYTRKFRKDGSQTYDYNNINIFGRQVIDTFFLSIKYDVQRKYPSYGLKQIIKHEGLERKDRVHVEASKIKDLWHTPSEREKIKEYAIHDADDSLALYDLMMPSYFYYTRSIPKNLQEINNSATGSQINSFLVRSYLQDNHSVPNASPRKQYEGAISLGNPGVYTYTLKVDVKSMYPSIMQVYKIYDAVKDPRANFLNMVKYFTSERFENQKLARETGDRHYRDIEQAGKLVINSAYGMLGATGLNFNSPDNAARVTALGRDILKKGMAWVDKQGYTLINVDTDSFTYSKGRAVSSDEFATDIEAINAMYPGGIVWEDDGLYEAALVLKAKNYILFDGNTYKYKGSALKDQKKEPALKEMLQRMTRALLTGEQASAPLIYNEYVQEILNITDISRWAAKKTVTEKLLTGEGTTEAKLREAIQAEQLSQGDKFYIYPAIDGLTQAIVKNEPVFYRNGEPKLIPNRVYRLTKYHADNVDIEHLFKRLFDTVSILKPVLDIELFTNFSLKKHAELLQAFKREA
jgi:DNA polymerase elongation subunit (family B)